ncbi:protein kinase superfamily protein [Actinidia rufa]|uniref:Protein kinase superfamily protein n=1 Tax=Actinidia rufa TaxID=165716 RepID=A0A7J0EAF7_9ERIC|nr:protein kinase superfamily protein [Actinidia rufa]
MITKPQFRPFFVFFIWVLSSALEHNFPNCENPSSQENFTFHCNTNESQNHCDTFALLRATSRFSSLTNLSSFLGINRIALAQANNFSSNTEFVPRDQPLLVPIQCVCNGGGFFEAELTRTALKGESFDGIASVLEGLTDCEAIREKNPSLSLWNVGEKVKLVIPLRCACPSSYEINQKVNFLISYPVSEGDSVLDLALKFNLTPETIISANNRSGASFKPQKLLPLSTILIPVEEKPVFGSREKSDLGFPQGKRKSKMWRFGIYVALGGVVFGAGIAILATFWVIQWRRKKEISGKMADLELQQLGLSIRTTSEKRLVETYTIEELRKATEDFSSSNLIEGSVFHGRLNGKNLAIKGTNTKTLAKVELGLFQDTTHHHPNIIRLIGTCSAEGNSDSFLVFEYAKNGSLKDWLHGGLAMKSHFIASCYCFLNWSQRLKICLDVAMALHYMHHIMIPSYVHGNIKSRNIFLDEEFVAKIGNFGLPNVATELSQSWSKGYLAPEYTPQGNLSPSIDIFAYGVVLLEVLSGKTPITEETGEGRVWLSEKIKSIVQANNAEGLSEWMDSALGEDYSFDGAVTLANLARACVENDSSLRPSAGEIVEKLSKLVDDLPEGEQFSICESSSKPLAIEEDK